MTWEKTHKDERGIWNEYKNESTGEVSIQEHKPKVVWKSCKQNEHQYEILGGRELKCKKCGYIVKFVPGRDNKLLSKYGIK